MKKSLMKIAGALLAAAALFFAGCTNGQGYSAAIDTVTTLDTPSIKVTAYPGMNYVSWTSVTGATSYYLTVYEDGVERYTNGTSTRTYAQNFYVDTTLLDGHSYKYRVEAISKTNPSGSRAVFVKNSAAESAEVKAIVPIANTEAIAFTELDESKNSIDYVVTSEGINVDTSKGYIRMSFPTKAYLQYTVYAKSEDYLNSVESNELSGSSIASLSYTSGSTYFRPSANNVNPTNFSLSVAAPGVYTVGTIVNAASGANTMYPSSNIVATKKITIPGIVTSTATGDVNYKWVTSDTARLYWKPAVLADTTTAKPANYYVYSYDAVNYTLTRVAGNVIENNDNFYYFEVKPTENTTYVVAYTVVEADETICVESRATTNKVTVNVASAATAAAPVSVAVNMTAADEDNIANDAVLTLKLAENTALKSVAYAVTDKANTYYALIDSEFTPVTFTAGDVYYEIPVAKDVAEGMFVAVQYVISSVDCEDYVSYVVSSTASGESSITAAAPLSSTITIIDADDDGKANDVKVAIMLDEATSLTSLVYTTSDVSANKARLLLDNPSAVKVIKFESGYEYNVVTIPNVEEGNYVAVKAVISAAGCKDAVVTLSTTSAIDTAKTTNDIYVISSNFIDADEDGNQNDYEILFVKSAAQTLAMYYATSDISDVEALKLTYSKAAKAVGNIETYADFGEIVVNKVVLKDIPVDNYVGIRYTLSETGFDDFADEIASSTTSGIFVTTDTADPIDISTENIVLTIDDNDRICNDATTDFTVEIGFNQTIKSIVYAVAEDEDILEGYLIYGKETKDIAVPTTYELKTTDTNPTVLTKVYTINPNVKNIADGKYIGMLVTIAEEGYNDSVFGLISEFASKQIPVTAPNVTVGDAYNYEYVDVLVTDDFDYDFVENYVYTIECTTEKEYEEGDPVWVVLPGLATKNFSIGSGNFAHRYSIPALGDYVIRVTKTRKAHAAVSGKEESVFKDTKFTVVDIPCTDIVSFDVTGGYEYRVISASEVINTDYDSLTNYTYNLYEAFVADDPETGIDEVAYFISLTYDEKLNYIYNNDLVSDPIAVEWIEDYYASSVSTNTNISNGARNPNVKVYNFNSRITKENPGVYCYRLTKERSTSAENSTAELYTEVVDGDVVSRIPNNMPNYTSFFSSVNNEAINVSFSDGYYFDYDTVANWKYELEYMLYSEFNPGNPDPWADVPTTKVTLNPVYAYSAQDLWYNSYDVYSINASISVEPNEYYARIIKTRVTGSVADNDSEKVSYSSPEILNVAYIPELELASVNPLEFDVTVTDQFKSAVDSASNWTYEVVYYFNDSDYSETLSLTFYSAEDGVETDDATVTIPVTAAGTYSVELYKIPDGELRAPIYLVASGNVEVADF